MIAANGEPIATVALGERIDPSNAPRPTNESERLLFRQLYETLVRVDCSGRARPGFAASWRSDDNGKTWLVTLDESARFADGTPVTADDVRASWMSTASAAELRPEVNRLVQSIVRVSDQTLSIALWRPGIDAPLALAHPDLAIAKVIADSGWPVGTRPTRIAPESTPQVMTLVRDHLPPIRFLVAPGDPRDLLDRDVDLLLTRDRAALNYAATLPQFHSLPLPWQRTYALLMPGLERSAPPLSDQARQVLAVDAVRGEARGAQGPLWWQGVTDCQVASSPLQGRPLEPRIVYDADDGAARDLAERFVGLGRASGPAASAILDALLPDRPRRAYRRAIGLTGETLARAVRLGRDAGYVLGIEREPLDACGSLKALVDRAPWLDPGSLVPLIDTRLHAVVRRGRSGLSREWDGGILIAPHVARNQP